MPSTDTRSFSHFAFVPLNSFSMIAFANAIEVLRMANYIEREDLYCWSVISADGADVMASNGLSVPSRQPDPDDPPHIVFVCGGARVEAAAGAAALAASQWENHAPLAMAFPKVALSHELFVIDRDRFTCSGGVAPLDMMLNIVSAQA